mmetsp:Transcript_2638/g.4719  ORF Transcript_2638/g.4719 Transcript_2638/m.4719 type:complete len:82 (+) Transcript_2638:687-932(+)
MRVSVDCYLDVSPCNHQPVANFFAESVVGCCQESLKVGDGNVCHSAVRLVSNHPDPAFVSSRGSNLLHDKVASFASIRSSL